MTTLDYNLNTGHRPIMIPLLMADGKYYMVYKKIEVTDDFLHRITQSISINRKVLEVEQAYGVKVHIDVPGRRNVVVYANTSDIIKQSLLYYDESKYYYPLRKWQVLNGDVDWVEKLLQDVKNNRLILRPRNQL